MNWFDKLFSDEDEEEVYQRKYSQRRQKLEEKERRRHALLPENNDIYERPKGNFRFPLHVNDDDNQSDESETASNHSEPGYEQAAHTEEAAYQKPDHRRHRRRRTFHDDTQEDSSFRTTRSSRKASQASAQRTQPSSEPPKRENQSRRVQNYSTRYDTKDIYYKSGEFKAEEVPSAIFGTKKRHPLENGVIQRSNQPSEESPKQHGKIPTDPLNGMRKSQVDAQTEMHESKDEQHESVNTPTNNAKTNRTPNYSKADNTININNIYASQIVEEIRRERERKVLQRKKFKEALQQKREQEDTSSIQKAIDDMYAEQAKQYVQDPVFQENGFEKEMEAESSQQETPAETEETNQSETSIDTNVSASQSSDENTVSEEPQEAFDYEEVDLNQVQSVQTLNEEDVKVVDDETFEAQNVSDEVLAESDASSETQETESQVQPEVADAQYTELAESDKDSDAETQAAAEAEAETAELEDETEPKTSSDEDDIDTTETSNAEYAAHEDEEVTHEPVLAPDNKEDQSQSISNTDESETESEHKEEKTNYEPQLKPDTVSNEAEAQPKANAEDVSESEQTDDVQENQDDTEISSGNTTSQASEQVSKAEEKPKVSKPIRKGAKPFNVMMTPSDKRRMMDARKRKAEPVLRPDDKDKTPQQESAPTEAPQAAQSSSEMQTHQTEDNDQQGEQGHITTSVNTQRTTQNGERHDQSKSQAAQQDNAHVHGPKAVSVNAPNEHHHEGIRRGPNLKLPSLDLLDEPEVHEVDQEWIDEKKQELNDAFFYFNVPAEVKNVTEGPSVTRFELSVEKGVKVSRITALHDDLKMALAAKDIRIEAPIPGTSLVGIEVPNVSPTKVNLKSIIESSKFKNAESKLTVAMGNRINNEPLLMDIAKTPHALIAGATGSGKSVCINSILLSLLYKNHPEELKLLLIDPKMVELAPYNGLPHLVSPVITDVKAATQSLKWAVDEMEKRYKLFAKYHVRNITAFNKKAPYEHRLPKIVIVIDELADLMMMAPQEVEQSIARIAQKARACGIHMLVATQRPSVNVITGLIKANIPTRIAFMVSSSVDSRTILDSGGAERLLGYGDMLYLGNGMNKPIRVQGSFVSDEEIDAVVDFIKEQREPEYLFEEKELLKQTKAQPKDDLFDDVCRFMVSEGNISTSSIQRHFQIGYNRAARIVDQLEELGYISGPNGSKPREVYLTAAEINEE
ncbi:DNA translocase FtsK [Staphylococcus simulans]|uniref:DNA translocase FtsK n=1 Tax=Staphylococcus simulans TaxID=1286 RepID=UPI001E4B7FBC|nr:DNA translocase FtsK [Staphylococcus simulans]MCD8914859.1 DNA translocase FtsK [Staphylococcus simulans]